MSATLIAGRTVIDVRCAVLHEALEQDLELRIVHEFDLRPRPGSVGIGYLAHDVLVKARAYDLERYGYRRPL